MEYMVVEVKWLRDGRFVGAPPISNEQSQLTDALNGFADDGWSVLDIHHDLGDGLRFSIVTLARVATVTPRSPIEIEAEGEGKIRKPAESPKPAQPASRPEDFPLTNGLYVGKDLGDTLFLRFGTDNRAIAETFAESIAPE